MPVLLSIQRQVAKSRPRSEPFWAESKRNLVCEVSWGTLKLFLYRQFKIVHACKRLMITFMALTNRNALNISQVFQGTLRLAT